MLSTFSVSAETSLPGDKTMAVLKIVKEKGLDSPDFLGIRSKNMAGHFVKWKLASQLSSVAEASLFFIDMEEASRAPTVHYAPENRLTNLSTELADDLHHRAERNLETRSILNQLFPDNQTLLADAKRKYINQIQMAADALELYLNQDLKELSELKSNRPLLEIGQSPTAEYLLHEKKIAEVEARIKDSGNRLKKKNIAIDNINNGNPNSIKRAFRNYIREYSFQHYDDYVGSGKILHTHSLRASHPAQAFSDLMIDYYASSKPKEIVEQFNMRTYYNYLIEERMYSIDCADPEARRSVLDIPIAGEELDRAIESGDVMAVEECRARFRVASTGQKALQVIKVSSPLALIAFVLYLSDGQDVELEKVASTTELDEFYVEEDIDESLAQIKEIQMAVKAGATLKEIDANWITDVDNML